MLTEHGEITISVSVATSSPQTLFVYIVVIPYLVASYLKVFQFQGIASEGKCSLSCKVSINDAAKATAA